MDTDCSVGSVLGLSVLVAGLGLFTATGLPSDAIDALIARAVTSASIPAADPGDALSSSLSVVDVPLE